SGKLTMHGGTNFLDVLPRRMMLLLQLDLQVGVLWAKAVGLIEQQRPIDGQPDVIGHQLEFVGRNQSTNRTLHAIEDARTFLESRADWYADVQSNHAG